MEYRPIMEGQGPARDILEMSASDLSHFLACRHRTALDLGVAQGAMSAPSWADPVLIALRERGLEHERRYVESLRGQGLRVVDLADRSASDAAVACVHAMAGGADIICQAALRLGPWFGRPDLLRRVEVPSALGSWSYEVIDTKLSRETRGGTILQLSLYSDLLREAQGAAPALFHVVTPDPATPVQTFRVEDFAAYFRLVRRRLEETALRAPAAIAASNYPEPVEHCDVCRWRSSCDTRRRDDDHLSLVAGISRLQTRELQAAGITTLAQLGVLPHPLPFVPHRGARETFERIREQARVQLLGRTRRAPVHELLLPIVANKGLAALPSPSPGDMFVDLEGDPFAREGGREYLFGITTTGDDDFLRHEAHWALSDAQERAAFEAVVDAILMSWAANPRMHVYHYAPYEPSAFRRLMGRHATREADVDRMLRAGLLVDLYAVVRHAIRASVERYSIKDLEPFYGFARAVDLGVARADLRIVERAIELDDWDAIDAGVRSAVEGYNREDCLSAHRLRSWLEGLRAQAERDGVGVPRPMPADGSPPKGLDERALRVEALAQVLTAGIPADPGERSGEQKARWLLAQMLDWHRREAKAPWWEFFRLRDLPEEELFEERAAVAGLRLVGRVGGTPRSPVDRYAFPAQETDVRDGDMLHLTDGTAFGTVAAFDRDGRTVDVKKRGAQAETHPRAVFAHSVVNSDVLAEAIFRIAEDVAGVDDRPRLRYRAALELLRCVPPRLRSGPFAMRDGETATAFATRIAVDLDGTVLPIQGPPGAGKTHTGACMVCELVRRGMRVGVAAVSHKVIRNLLNAVLRVAGESATRLGCVHKVTTRGAAVPGIEEVTENDAALGFLSRGEAHVVGGTAWLWARPEFAEAVDVLFVDEAGQMSLANVLAMSQTAGSVVLLGDPQQLEQPQQGSHPEGTEVSALEHVLQGRQTVPAERGIFLSETWRLAPSICAFTSEVFYDRRLHSRPGLERQALAGAPPFEGSGLWVVGVDHQGNQNSSPEEADAVGRIAASLLQFGSRWTDVAGAVRPLAPHDILVVAPYNAQVALLDERLRPVGVRVGTVDKFQGQEAPVVIYSMATSRPEDAPRGMEFLYSLNRLNVATSRARCACILVANPRLLDPDCATPRQMLLANALCRYVELARMAEVP